MRHSNNDAHAQREISSAAVKSLFLAKIMPTGVVYVDYYSNILLPPPLPPPPLPPLPPPLPPLPPPPLPPPPLPLPPLPLPLPPPPLPPPLPPPPLPLPPLPLPPYCHNYSHYRPYFGTSILI